MHVPEDKGISLSLAFRAAGRPQLSCTACRKVNRACYSEMQGPVQRMCGVYGSPELQGMCAQSQCAHALHRAPAYSNTVIGKKNSISLILRWWQSWLLAAQVAGLGLRLSPHWRLTRLLRFFSYARIAIAHRGDSHGLPHIPHMRWTGPLHLAVTCPIDVSTSRA